MRSRQSPGSWRGLLIALVAIPAAGCPPGAVLQLPMEAIGPVKRVESGTLHVHTPTYVVEDGQVFYYPHRPYEIYDTDGRLVQRVSNHRSRYDERPTSVLLPPGQYLVAGERADGRPYRLPVAVEAGQLTRVMVEEILDRLDETERR